MNASVVPFEDTPQKYKDTKDSHWGLPCMLTHTELHIQSIYKLYIKTLFFKNTKSKFIAATE